MQTYIYKDGRKVGTIHHRGSLLGQGRYFLHAVIGTPDGALCHCPKFTTYEEAREYAETHPSLVGSYLSNRLITWKEWQFLA